MEAGIQTMYELMCSHSIIPSVQRGSRDSYLRRSRTLMFCSSAQARSRKLCGAKTVFNGTKKFKDVSRLEESQVALSAGGRCPT